MPTDRADENHMVLPVADDEAVACLCDFRRGRRLKGPRCPIHDDEQETEQWDDDR